MLFLPVNQPAGQVSAAQHQVEVVQLFQLLFPPGQRLDHLLALIVTQEQDMRKLQRCASPDGHAGRDPFRYRLLGRTHRGVDLSAVVVLLQIHHADEAAAELSVMKRALDIEEAVRVCPQEVFSDILFHGLMDARDRLFRGAGETALRQNQMLGRRDPFGQGINLLPVRGLGGKLITCDDCPALQLTVLREENVGSTEAVIGFG